MGQAGAEASGDLTDGTAIGGAPASDARRRRVSFTALLDGFFFVYAGIAAVWLAWLVFTESFSFGWFGIAFFVVFWLVLAYLVLPRLHRILTRIYVPDYFIGRARTSDGLLGDPVNLAFDGEEASVHAAMTQAGWTRADDVTGRSSWRIITSTITRKSYDEAPVSPLFLFSRQQDFAYQQEVEGNPAKRHHVRFWRTPDGWLLPGGRRVDWLAAGTFDRAVGFSLFTLQITHKIDADTDVERDHIVDSVLAANPTARVDVLADFSTGYHSRNGGGDTISTDGDLPVVDTGAAALLSPAQAAEAAASAATAADVAAARRPVATVFGAVLVVLRVIAGVVWLISLAMQWRQVLVDDLGVPLDSDRQADAASNALLAIVLVAGGVVLAVELVFALLVYRGSNWARVTVMVFATISITWSAVDFLGGGEITLRTTLITVALDILVLLALSSRAARSYARRRRSPRLRPAASGRRRARPRAPR
ncbi:LssY C-terminal domain-containing protein [Agromyces sp. NPDC055520]